MEKDTEKEKRKLQDKIFVKLRQLKDKAAKCTMQTTDILHLVETHPAWSWANNPFATQALKHAQQDFHNFKSQNSFWQSWQVEDNIMQYVRRTWKESEYTVELNRIGELETVINKLQQEAQILQKMHKIRSA